MTTSTDLTRQQNAHRNDQTTMITRHAENRLHAANSHPNTRPGVGDPPDRRKSEHPDHVPGPRDTRSPARAGDVLLAALRSQVAELRAEDPHVREEIPGAVTLMRVATRRLRSTLSGFAWFLDPEHTRTVAEELKWLGAQLAEQHDVEVMIERLTHVLRALPEPLIMGPLAADLERALGALIEQGEKTITVALNSQRYLALQTMLDQLLNRPPLTKQAGELALTDLPRSVAKAFRKLNRLLNAADALPPGPDRDTALHEARKACKQVRYMTEVVTPLVGEPAQHFHRQTEKLQELLGNYQDAVMARPVLRQLAEAAHADGHNAFTYGVLYALEHARMGQVLDELPHRLEQLRDEQTLTWLPQDLIRQPAHNVQPNWTPAPRSPETNSPGESRWAT
jgi:CHAD domain-containing protein